MTEGPSYVVTGGGRGVGRAVVERLLRDGGTVVVIELDREALSWVPGHPAAGRLIPVVGSAADRDVTERAADHAESAGLLTGWVNNAAVFRDAPLHSTDVLPLVTANLAPVLTGAATAVRRFLAAGRGGAVVNVSSHQAQRPVRGALAYATAKAAVEGLTRALAVDYGDAGIRVNAVALGSIDTERYRAHLASQGPAAAAGTEAQLRALHPLGRIGTGEEVAAAVVHLLSEDAGFITGAVVPVDGGRAVRGSDPEET